MDPMRTKPFRHLTLMAIGATALAAASLLEGATPIASASEWNIDLVRPLSSTLDPATTQVSLLATGRGPVGFVLGAQQYLSDGSGFYGELRFDHQGRLTTTSDSYIGVGLGRFLSDAQHEIMLTGGGNPTTADPVSVDTLCRRELLPDGRERLLLNRTRNLVPGVRPPGFVDLYYSVHAIRPGAFSAHRDGGGGSWVLYYEAIDRTRLVRFEPDCSMESIATLAIDPFWFKGDSRLLVNATDARAAYVALPPATAGAPGSVARFDRSGEVWRYPLAADERVLQLDVLPGGDVLLVGGIGDGVAAFLRRIDAAGRVIWPRTFLPVDAIRSDIGPVHYAISGDQLLVGAHDAVFSIGSDGGVVRLHRNAAPAVALVPDQGEFSDVLFEHGYGVTSVLGKPTISLSRWQDGVVAALSPAASGRRTRARLADGRVLTTIAPPAEPRTAVFLDLPGAANPASIVLPSVPTPQRTQHLLSDADRYFAVLNGTTAGPALYRFSTDGQVVWRRPLQQGVEGWSPTYALGADRVCHVWAEELNISAAVKLTCLRVSDGERLFEVDVTANAELIHPKMWISSGGEIRLMDHLEGVTSGGDSPCLQAVVHSRFDASGALLARRVLDCFRARDDGAGELTWTPDGGVAYARQIGDRVTLRRFTPDATLRYDATLEAMPRGPLEFGAGGDVSAFLRTDDRRLLVRLDASGARVWTHPLPDGIEFVEQLVPLTSGWLVAGAGYAGQPHRVVRLDAEGRTRWSIEFANRRVSRLVHDAVAEGLWIADPESGQVQGFDATTGRQLGERHLPPLDYPTAIDTDFALDAQGGLRIDVPGRAMLRRPREFAMEYPRVDHCSLDGVWYRPQATGQGVFIHRYAQASRTSIAAAWFTFGPGRSRSGLRWYTLQGEIDADATHAQLDILRNDGGVFADGTTTSTTVGRASLRRLSDTELRIDYRLDVADGAVPVEGSLLLQPLLPDASACAPSSAVAQNAAPAFASGFWYDLGTSGQGLALYPIGAGAALAGAWFTFDPAGKADDALQQHWFTFSGTRAANGSYALELMRTIDGALDSRPTRNTYRVGRATLRFDGCELAHIEYAFDDGDLAATFAGVRGQQALQAIARSAGGGCGATVED
jgi:hypothetical protein